MLIVSLPVYFLLRHGVVAPYGKHSNSNWGPSVNAKLAWFLFESPNLAWSLYVFMNKKDEVFDGSPANAILLSLYVIHYINRCCLYPIRISSKSQPVNIAIISSGFAFCSLNGFLQTMHYCSFSSYPPYHHTSIKFIVGTAIWFLGFLINMNADGILRKLRNTPPTNVYKIPQGGLFNFVSGANFFGEILEWLGYAIASQSLAGWAFWVWVVANLVPRGLAHHEWYLAKFEDYPKQRKAVIPFIL